MVIYRSSGVILFEVEVFFMDLIFELVLKD